MGGDVARRRRTLPRAIARPETRFNECGYVGMADLIADLSEALAPSSIGRS